MTVVQDALLLAAGFQIGMPRSLTIEPTNFCNQTCPICGAAQRPGSERGFMAWDLFREIVAQASALKPEKIFLHARGESLLHPRIVDMVRELNRGGFETHLFTNGDLLTCPLSAALRDAGLDHLVISFPGVSKENGLACRGRLWAPDFPDRLAESLSPWQNGSGKASLNVTLLPKTLADPMGSIRAFLLRWLTSPGLHGIQFSAYQPWPRLAIEEYIPFIYSRPRLCPLMLHSLTVLWDGAVTPCSYDVEGLLSLGSCSDTDLTRLFNGARLRKWRRLVSRNSPRRPSMCKSCLVNRVPFPSVFIASSDLPSEGTDTQHQWLRLQSRRIFNQIRSPLRTRTRQRNFLGFRAVSRGRITSSEEAEDDAESQRSRRVA